MTKKMIRGSETCCKIGGIFPRMCHFVYGEQALTTLSDPLALKIQEEAMSGKMGANPQDKLFIPKSGICHWP